jgi:hypothetical protein
MWYAQFHVRRTHGDLISGFANAWNITPSDDPACHKKWFASLLSHASNVVLAFWRTTAEDVMERVVAVQVPNPIRNGDGALRPSVIVSRSPSVFAILGENMTALLTAAGARRVYGWSGANGR